MCEKINGMVNYALSGENNVVSVLSTCIIENDNFIHETRQLIKMNYQITEAHFATVISTGSVWQFQHFGLTWTSFLKLFWGDNSSAEGLDLHCQMDDVRGGKYHHILSVVYKCCPSFCISLGGKQLNVSTIKQVRLLPPLTKYSHTLKLI